MSDEIAELLKGASHARREHRPENAKRDQTAAVELCRASDIPADLAQSLTGQGEIERDPGHLDHAREHYEAAAAIYRADRNLLRLAHTDERTEPLDLANAIRALAILKRQAGENLDAPPRFAESTRRLAMLA